MLERFLLEEDRWKVFLLVGPEQNDGGTGTSCCSLKDKNMSAKISEGIDENEYSGEQVSSCSAHLFLIKGTVNRQAEALLNASST